MPPPEPFTLQTREGRTLHGYLDLPAEPGPRPAIVACHGFKGFMEWGFFPYLAELLAQRGFVVVRFNFSGAGMRPGDELVTDLDAFRQNTLSRELDETLEVLAAVAGGRLTASVGGGRVDPERLGLFGHSRGGGTAIVAAARPEWRHRLRALVTWSAVSTFERFGREQVEAWQRDGVLEILNVRTGQKLPLGLGMLADYRAHRAELDVAAAAAARRAPWLIVHGDQDETVPYAEASVLAAAAAPPAELLIVPGGDHGLGGRHPFPGPRPPLIQALNATQTWFRRWV